MLVILKYKRCVKLIFPNISELLHSNTFCCCYSVTKSFLTLCNPMDCMLLCSLLSLQSLLKFMFIDLVMLSNHLILCCPLLLLPSIFPCVRVFPVSQLFVSGGQSIGASASASVLPMNIQDWFPLGLTGLISLLSKGLKNTFQHNSKASILRCPAFFMVQFSHLYMTTRKIICIRLLESQKLLEKKLWLYGPLSTKWCFCFSICCLAWS